MAKTKTYVVAPNFSMPSDFLQLGDIVVNPLDLELVPLNRKARVKIPDDDLSQVGIMEEFSATRQKLLSGRFGLWTTFLACLGIPDVVKMYLKDSKYAVPVYMITGLKIAKGASVNLDDGVKLDGKVGVTLPKAVADAKPIIQIIRNRTDGISFTSKTDFILAFRAREVTYDGVKAQHKLSLKGTSMLDGDEAVTGEILAILGDDYSRHEATKEAYEEEFEVRFLEEEDESGEVEWIVADLTAEEW
ncbi:hypothetical protein CEP53_006248 [Fusarium sp. AF-6]|nr:hypothetical protein CEP53_006248 [Fusarium sp. AF-6]